MKVKVNRKMNKKITIDTRPGLEYSDVYIKPNFSNIKTRKEVNVGFENEFFNIAVPVISANMDTITEADMAIGMQQGGGIGALHRFMKIDDNVKMFNTVKTKTNSVFVSVGLMNQDDVLADAEFRRASELYGAGARLFIIDTAHGDCERMLKTIKYLKTHFKDIYVVGGNITTFDSVFRLEDAGVDAVKIGIGGGKVCLTKNVTGVTMPMFSAICECSYRANVDIIADGGIREIGDIAKAIGAGANMIMSGFMFAGAIEAASHSEYRGMASAGAMSRIRDMNTAPTPEGTTIHVKEQGSVVGILNDMKGGLQSSFSYVGARNMNEFQEKIVFGIRHNK